MLAPTFEIWIRTADGQEIMAFTWCRDAASGCARARAEGPKFGHQVAAAWAVAIAAGQEG